MKTSIGGDRLGSGSKMITSDRKYERSTHDLSYTWKSSMSSGTLVPFMKQIMMPGDSMEIDLDSLIYTLPTIGPLFGSFKAQYDVFQVPIRLYSGALMLNTLDIGRNMQNVKLPEIFLVGENPLPKDDVDNYQISPSCIFKYLGISGLGLREDTTTGDSIARSFNAVPWLAYWDIYKNYYANKQEEIGAVIRTDLNAGEFVITSATLENNLAQTLVLIEDEDNNPPFSQFTLNDATTLTVVMDDNAGFDINKLNLWYSSQFTGGMINKPVTEIFATVVFDDVSTTWILSNPNISFSYEIETINFFYLEDDDDFLGVPRVETFPLKNLDKVRELIMQKGVEGDNIRLANTAIEPNTPTPFAWALDNAPRVDDPTRSKFSCQYGQEGLGIKTYQSDLFNNWLSTEWLDGENGVNAVTAIDTSGDSFTLDQLNLNQKLYNMLNRIALSGGSYDDWLSAVYEQSRKTDIKSPMYVGGMSRELVFHEVVSNSASEGQPLATLAGKGRFNDKKKGGHIEINAGGEACYVMGIVSLTPRIEYSQGNEWDVNLRTMDDLHKPALDGIGFQELITDQMAWWDSRFTTPNNINFKSVGKQPAWINYQTNVDVIRGNFAITSQERFMVLDRRYEYTTITSSGLPELIDATTYIDPTKFNHIFADTRLDAQNFWMQIGVKMKARRLMSARQIPNL